MTNHPNRNRNPYVVIKRQRAGDGWISYRGTGYADETTAIGAARKFAHEQCADGVRGTQIFVRRRNPKAEIVTFRWDEGPVRMIDWREGA